MKTKKISSFPDVQEWAFTSEDNTEAESARLTMIVSRSVDEAAGGHPHQEPAIKDSFPCLEISGLLPGDMPSDSQSAYYKNRTLP